MIYGVSMQAQISSLRVNVRTDTNTYFSEDSRNFKDQILISCQKLMSEYYDKATLLDPEERIEVNTKSLEAFKELFFGNARIFNDLQEYGGSIPMDNYTGLVIQNLKKTGVSFRISDMLVKKIERNTAIESLNFEVTIRVNKLLQQSIAEGSGKVILHPEFRLVPMDFILIVQGEDLKDVKIYSIEGKTKPRPKPHYSDLCVSASFGFPIFSQYELHNGFKYFSGVELRSRNMFDVGAKYSRSFARGKHLRWIIGLSYGRHGWNLEPKDDKLTYSVSATTSRNYVDLSEDFNYKTFNNKIDFSFFQGVLGLMIPIKKIQGYRMEYWLEINALPTFISRKESLLDPLVNRLSVVVWDSLREEYCNEVWSNNNPQLAQNFTSSDFILGLQIKPGIRYYLPDRKSALSFGIGYVYYLESWIPNEVQSVHSNSAIGPNSSFLLKSLQPSLLRIEIGYIIKM